ncbi:MAG TPA: immunoglobulin domain-containing protein, partial [Verrucomicrobiae bacterium]
MQFDRLRNLSLIVCLISGGAWTHAACPVCASFDSGVMWGAISFGALTEASGIAASARNPGVLWTHNDGSAGRIWAVSTNGARLATYDVNNVADVEDIAVGPGPTPGLSYLYIGDIGGNVGTNAARADVKIIRIPEPAVDLAWANDPRSPNFNGRDNFTLIYPDGSFDAETLFVDPLTSDVWVVTKETGVARFYRANLNAVPDNGTVVLEFVRLVAFHQASAGDMSADGTQLVLRRENVAALWLRCDGEPLSNALARASQSIPVIGPPTEPNGEGLALLRDGTGYVTISEGSNAPIYFFRSLCPAAPRFTLMLSNQSVFVGGSVQFHALAAGYPDATYTWRRNGQVLVGETGSSLLLSNVSPSAAGQYEIVASNASGSTTNIATLAVRAKPDLRITEVMPVAAASPGVPTADWWELTSFESQPVSLNGWRFNDNSGGLADAF